MEPETQLLLILGQLQPSEADLARAEKIAASPLNPEDLTNLVVKNKVLPAFLHNARRLPRAAGEPLLRMFSEMSTRLDLATSREKVMRNLDEILGYIGRHGDRVMAIKGSSLPFLVPDYQLRALNDLDLLFPDGRSISLAAQVLAKNGYEIEEGGEAPFVCRVSAAGDGRDLLAAHFTVYGGGCKFDMHSTNLVVTGCPLPPIDCWKRATSHVVVQNDVLVPCPEDALLLLLVHATDHGHLTLKDYNDVVALLERHGPTLDWDYLVSTAAASRLDRLLAFVISQLERHFSLSNLVPESFRSRLRKPGAFGWLLGRAGTNWSRKSWFTAAFVAGVLAAEYSKRRGGTRFGLPLVVRNILLSARWLHEDRFLGNLAESLLRKAHPKPLFRPLPPRHVPIYLTEVTTEMLAAWLELDLDWNDVGRILREAGFAVESLPEACLEVVRDGIREVVASPAGLFTPTLTFVFTEEEYREIEALGADVLRAAASRASTRSAASGFA